LEAKKDRSSKRVREILSKNLKNINEIIESNSKFQNVVKRFELSSPHSEPAEKKYEFEFIDVNVKFYEKCREMTRVISTFMDYLLP
jgi:hypothetical protein